MNAKTTSITILASLLFIGIVGAQDQMPEMESDVPGQIHLFRWDGLLNQAGADAVTKVAVPIQSSSKVYQGYSCSGFELRQAVADAIANNGVEGIARQLTLGQPWTANDLNLTLPPLYFNYFDATKPRGPRLNGSVGL